MARPDFQHTQPASMALLTGHELDDFRVVDAAERLALLRRLLDGGELVHLSTPKGASYSTVLWTVDQAQRRLGFDVDPMSGSLPALLEADHVTAVAYVDAVKLQFDLGGFVLLNGATGHVLQATMPEAMYRFQRRASFRVRTRRGATAHLRHPSLPDMQLALRVLDVSTGGCAMEMPGDVPPIQPGITLARVRLELDGDTRFETDITVQHISGGFGAPEGGVRLGCAFGTLDGTAQRALQRYIDTTQRRKRLLEL
ncbi:MAG TPA: flagellar regulator YcgR PilZN domain-containing protein [Burkholderiaceae bacterium]|nr:flagellar regulator YcgR PilZN domain-containing protein [Burkholderiaceae bacterium]